MNERQGDSVVNRSLSRRQALQWAGGTFGLNLASLWQAQLSQAAASATIDGTQLTSLHRRSRPALSFSITAGPVTWTLTT